MRYFAPQKIFRLPAHTGIAYFMAAPQAGNNRPGTASARSTATTMQWPWSDTAKNAFTLHIGCTGAWLQHPRYAPEGLFAAKPEQAADLAQLLLAAPQCPLTVIADDATQELRYDQMPLLRGIDRRRLIVRRVQQHYPDEPFAACIASQRMAEHERLMILHLPIDGVTPRWLRWSAAMPNPPAGTIATTKIAAALLWRLAGNDLAEWTHGFFLTDGGLRHVTLREGHPLLTRQIPLPSRTPQQIAATLQQAVQSAQLYLARHGWREDQSEQIIGVLPPDLLEATRLQLPPAMLLLSPAEVGRWLHLPAGTPDWLQLCRVAAAHYRPSLYPHYLPTERAILQQNMMARCGTAIAASLLLLGFGLAGNEFLNVRQVREQLAVATTESRGIQQAAMTARQQMGDVAIARVRLRQARLLQQDKHAPTPWPFLLAVGKALPDQMRINHLHWEPQPDGSVKAALKLRVLNAAGNKDAVQQEALLRYADFTSGLVRFMPTLEIKTTQMPYALGPHETFNDPSMLQTVAVGEANAELEVRMP